jgi:hypothetical protein
VDGTVELGAEAFQGRELALGGVQLAQGAVRAGEKDVDEYASLMFEAPQVRMFAQRLRRGRGDGVDRAPRGWWLGQSTALKRGCQGRSDQLVAGQVGMQVIHEEVGTSACSRDKPAKFT